MSGASHFTFSEVRLAVTSVGLPGLPGGSFMSVTLMLTVTVSSTSVSALPSESFLSLTDTVTLYEVLAS